MATETSSLFTKYDLTLDERRMASQLNDLQRMLIQTEIAIAAEEKVKLTFNPLNPQEFVQREAELQGRINFGTYLLTLNDQAIEEIRMLAEASRTE